MVDIALPTIRKTIAAIAATALLATMLATQASAQSAAKASTVSPTAASVASVTKYPDIEYKVAGGVHLTLDVYVPQGPGMSGPFPAALMIHGGGWADGSKNELKGYAQDFAMRGFVAYVMNFRQSCDPADPPPDTPVETCGYMFPTQLEDIRDSLIWIRENAPLHPEWKTMADRVIAWGASSGGNLAANLGTGWNLTGGPEGTYGYDKPEAVVSWSGGMDLLNGTGEPGKPGRGKAYLGCDPQVDCPDELLEQVSPLYNLTADDPPTFLMHATNDPILPIDEHAIPMYDALQGLGIPSELYVVDGACHGLKCVHVDPTLEDNTAAWMHQTLGPFQPTVSIDSGPAATTPVAQATFAFSVGAGVTTTCSFDGAPAAPCTSPVHLTDLVPGPHAFTVVGADDAGTAGDPSIYHWLVKPVTVAVQDSSFTPPTVAGLTKGAVVRWTNTGANPHTVTDTSGMGLFDSGALAPGDSFDHVFLGAGVYPYTSTSDTGMNGQIKLGVGIAPQTVTPGDPVTIQWAGDTAPSALVYDIQLKRPGANKWQTLMSGQKVPQGTFVPDLEGTYRVRGRTRSTDNGMASGWSGATQLTVTTDDITPPTTTITSGPPSPTTATSATFSFSADEADVSFRCSLDGGAQQGCNGGSASYPGLSVGWHTFTVIGVDQAGNVGDPDTWNWYVSRVGNVAIRDSGSEFDPANATASLGMTIRWTNQGNRTHTVTDASAVGLFDSGPIPPGGTFQQWLFGASTYPYICSIHRRHIAVVQVPMQVTPHSGGTTTPFHLIWSVKAPPPDLMFDIYVKRPGAAQYDLWKLGSEGFEGVFLPDAGPGKYRFFTRIRTIADVALPPSPPVVIVVH